MKKAPSVALLCAGTISRSEITRVPNLIRSLGPIKAGTMRVASRAANTLRAGYPVADYKDLADASLILIAAPLDRATDFIVELTESDLDWSKKALMVTGSALDSSALLEIEALGASTGCLHIVDFPSGPLCIVEGQDGAVRTLRNVMGSAGSKMLRIRYGDMPRCYAALCLASHCFLPLIDACVSTLVEAGVEAPQAEHVADRLLVRSLRAYSKAGRQSWSPVDRELMLDRIAKIGQENPLLAGYYEGMFELARQWMEK